MRKNTRKQDMHRLRLGISGFFRCLYILAKDRHTHYVLSTYGVGDALMACAYLKAYKKAYNIPHITLVGKKSKEDIFKMYRGEYDELMILDDAIVVRLTDAFLFDFAYHLFYKWMFRITPVLVNCHIRNFDCFQSKDNIFYQTATMRNLYKSLLYMLPENVAAVRPDMSFLPDIHETAHSLGAEHGTSVVLLPYANSIELIDIGFWNSLVERLSYEGYVCFTNVSSLKERPLPRTKAISYGLAETLAFTQYCGNMVSIRNGVCDVAQYIDCKMTVIYSDKDKASTQHFYKLGENEAIAGVLELNYNPANREEIITEICTFLRDTRK